MSHPTASKLLACLARLGRDLSGRMDRTVRKDRFGKYDQDEHGCSVVHLYGSRIRSLAWLTRVTRQRGIQTASTARERASIEAASTLAWATCATGTELRSIANSLTAGVQSARAALRENDFDHGTKKLMAAAFSTLAKLYALRGDLETTLSLIKRWSEASNKTGIARNARPIEAGRLGASVARAREARTFSEAESTIRLVAKLAALLPVHRAQPKSDMVETAIAAFLLDKVRHGSSSVAVVAEAASKYVGNELQLEPSTQFASALVAAYASTPGQLKQALRAASTRDKNSPELSVEAMTALVSGAVDEYKRAVLQNSDVDTGRSLQGGELKYEVDEWKTANNINEQIKRIDSGEISEFAIQEAYADLQRALDITTPMAQRLTNFPEDQGARDGFFVNNRLAIARASAHAILGDVDACISSLETLPARLTPAVTIVAADSRFAHIFRKIESPIPLLARLSAATARAKIERASPHVRKRNELNQLEAFVAEVLRAIAFFSGFSRREYSAQAELASWGLTFAGRALTGELLTTSSSSLQSTNAGKKSRKVSTRSLLTIDASNVSSVARTFL